MAADDALETAYNAESEATLAKWALRTNVGAAQTAPFHPTRISITTGSYLPHADSVAALLARLADCVEADPVADLISPANLHATFLALSQPLYDSEAAIPALPEVREAFDAHCQGQTMRLHGLRLVALPNALILAGQPDSSTFERRQSFARALLASSWRVTLQERYPGRPIPPLFWHSTLLRYHAELLPEHLRRFFLAERGQRYGSISVPIRLLATSYDWKVARPLAGTP